MTGVCRIARLGFTTILVIFDHVQKTVLVVANAHIQCRGTSGLTRRFMARRWGGLMG